MDKEKLFDFFLYFIIGYSYFFLTRKLTADIMWFLKAEINPIRFLKHFLSNYLPFYLFILPLMVYFNIPKNRNWQKIFNWKLWIFPFLGFILFGVSQWQFTPTLNYQTQIFGFQFRWQWAAMVEWSLLFITQLFLYQKNGMHKALAFAISFYGVFLAGVLYEIPWYFKPGTENWASLFKIKNVFVAFAFPAILHHAKWKLNRLLLLGLIPLIILYPSYYMLPSAHRYWLVRLFTFPLFIMIPLTLKNEEVM